MYHCEISEYAKNYRGKYQSNRSFLQTVMMPEENGAIFLNSKEK